MPTVRIRDASEYPETTQKLFEPAKSWFNYDFKQPPAMSRVMAWDPEFGVTQMFSSYTKIADMLQLEPDMSDIALVDSSPAPGGSSKA